MKRVIIALLIIILIGVGGFFIINRNSDDESSNSNQNVSSGDQTKEMASINELLARGENIRCTYDYRDDAGNSNQGTAYLAGNKMFGDFSVSQVDGTTLQSNVLRLDTMQYVWDKNTKEGYKIDTSALETQQSENTSDNNQNEAVDQDKKFEFNCIAWDVDESLFEVPADVNFIDNTQAIQDVQQNTEQLSSTCKNITDSTQRAACEQAVGAQ